MGTSPVQQVFINCPFDSQYQSLFEAIVFAVSTCGFNPRCALEVDDGSQARIEKIFDIIGDCRFGIHDISKTELDGTTNLPRFNMPLELGIFLGAKKFGQGRQKEKICLIFDRERYRYQKFISDLSAYDIRAHEDDPRAVILHVRKWLQTSDRSLRLPGGESIADRYVFFRGELPTLCLDLQLSPEELTFIDYLWIVKAWLDQNP